MKNRTQKSTKPRTLVIGDIHGSALALEQVLDRAYVNENDTIVQIGDVVDGWSENVKCTQMLIDLAKTNKCVFVRGNHDIWIKDFLNMGHQSSLWIMNGGLATYNDYVTKGETLNGDHRDFYNNQVNWFIDDDNRLFIHGGWDYKASNGDFVMGATYPVNAGIGAMECHWDRSLFKGAASSVYSQQPFKATREFKEVFIGHTATRGEPLEMGNVYNVDTGCGWHGKLTIMDVDTHEYWQSDLSKDLYPDEKGR